MMVGLCSRRIVLNWDPAPLPRKGAESEPPPQFSAHFYCGQTVGFIKMPLDMEVGLSPGDFVLDGNPAPPPPKRGSPLPNFRPMSTAVKRLDGSRWHLAWRWALVQATLCHMGTQLPSPKRAQPPIFDKCPL